MAESTFSYMKRLDGTDRRQKSKVMHRLSEMITCVICGLLAGRENRKQALEWCRNHIDDLRKFMPLEYGVASEATLCRALRMISEEDLQDIFHEWACRIAGTVNAFLSIDGKGLRGAAEKIKGERVPYVLNAADIETALCTGIVRVGKKSNEKTAFHDLLEQIDIAGSMIVADAMATDQNIICDIISRGGDFLLQVKKNNPDTYREIHKQMDEVRKQAEDMSRVTAYREAAESFTCYMASEGNRERNEYRTCMVTNDASLLGEAQERYGGCLRTIGTVESVRVPRARDVTGNDITPGKREFLEGKEVKEGDGITDDVLRVGIISSKILDAEAALAAKRDYWTVENCLHKVLDDTFGEDRDTSTVNRYRMAILRRWSYNLMRIMQAELMPSASARSVCSSFCDRSCLLRYVFSETENIRQS